MLAKKEKSSKIKIIAGLVAVVIFAGIAIYAGNSGLFQGYLKLNDSTTCESKGTFGSVNLAKNCVYTIEDIRLTIGVQSFDRSSAEMKSSGVVASNFKLTAGGNPYIVKNGKIELVSITYKGMDRAGNAVLILEKPTTIKNIAGDCKDQETAGGEDITLCVNTTVTHTVNNIKVHVKDIKNGNVELTFTSPADTLNDDFTLEIGQKLVYGQSPSTLDVAARTGTAIIPQGITSDGRVILRVESENCDNNYSDIYETADFTSSLCINKQVFMSDRGGVQGTVTDYDFSTGEATINFKIPDPIGSTHTLITKIIPVNEFEEITHETPNGRYIHSFNNRGYNPATGLINIEAGTVECLNQIAEDGEVFKGCINNTLTYDTPNGDVVITRGPATNDWIELEISNSNNPVFEEGEIRLPEGETAIVGLNSVVGSYDALALTYEANNGVLIDEITCESDFNAATGESYQNCVKTYLGSQNSKVNFLVNRFTDESIELTANVNSPTSKIVQLAKNSSIAIAKSQAETDFVGSKVTFFGDNHGKALIGHSEVNCPTVQLQSGTIASTEICMNKWFKHDATNFKLDFTGVVNRNVVNATIQYPENVGTTTKQVELVQNTPQTYTATSTNGESVYKVTFTGFNNQTGKAQFSLDICSDQTAIDGQTSQICFNNDLTLNTSQGNIKVTPQAQNTDGSLNVWINGAKDSRSGTGEVIKLAQGESLVLAGANLGENTYSYSTKLAKFERMENSKAVFSSQTTQCLSYEAPGELSPSASQRELCPYTFYENSDNDMAAIVTKFSNQNLTFLIGQLSQFARTEHTLTLGNTKAIAKNNTENEGTAYTYRGKSDNGKAKLEMKNIRCVNRIINQSSQGEVLCINKVLTHSPSGIRIELLDSTQTTAKVKVFYKDDNFDREQTFDLFINEAKTLDSFGGGSFYRANFTFKGNNSDGLSIFDLSVVNL